MIVDLQNNEIRSQPDNNQVLQFSPPKQARNNSPAKTPRKQRNAVRKLHEELKNTK